MTKNNVNITPQTFFGAADDVVIDSSIKVHIQKNDDEENVHKTGKVNLLFIDQQTKSVIARLQLDPYTAHKLGEVLSKNMESVIKEINSKELPPDVREQFEKQQEKVFNHSYIG